MELQLQLTFFHYRSTQLFILIMSNDNSEAYVSDASDFEEEMDMPAMPSMAIGILQYQFDPLDHSSHNEALPENRKTPDTASRSDVQMRVGKTNWCICRHCKPMDSEEERKKTMHTTLRSVSLCENFMSVCLHKEVLKVTLGGLNSLRGDGMIIENRSMRYAGYSIFTWWVHNWLCRGVQKAIPSGRYKIDIRSKIWHTYHFRRQEMKFM